MIRNVIAACSRYASQHEDVQNHHCSPSCWVKLLFSGGDLFEVGVMQLPTQVQVHVEEVLHGK